MRKRLLSIALFALMLLSIHYVPANADGPIRILVNGNSRDPVFSDITLFYSEFARAMRESGATVDRASLYRITDATLAGYDILIMPIPALTLNDADKSALRRFISEGGGVLLMSWLDSPISDNANIEGFTADYGIRLGELEPYAYIIADIVQNSPLAAPEPARDLFVTNAGVQILATPGEAEDALLMSNSGHSLCAYSTKTSMLGKGRLVVFGNDLIFIDPVLRMRDGIAMAHNLIRYLASETIGPDLAVTSLSLKARHLFPGDGISVSATVKNLGGQSSAATMVTFTLCAWDDATRTAGKTVKVMRTVPVSELASGADKLYSTAAKLPGSLDPGKYVVVVTVDPAGLTLDANTVNNRRISKRFTVH